LERRLVVLETSILELLVFSVLALFMIGGSIAVITNKQTIFSAFGFLLVMIALAGMFALLQSQFLALAQIMISVGAVVVLSMLTILTVNLKEENLPKEKNRYKWMIVATLLVLPITYLLYRSMDEAYIYFVDIDKVSSQVVGKLLFSDWVLPFEIVSILLLTAMLGAIVIARKDDTEQKGRT